MIFRELSVRPEDAVSISLWLGDFPSTFRAAGRPSVNLSQLFVQPEDLTSTSRVAWRPAVNFREVSLQQGDLPSTSM